VRGLVAGSWSDAQAAALAMAILLRGMDTTETVALTAR
jgi:thymidine phosphorylase